MTLTMHGQFSVVKIEKNMRFKTNQERTAEYLNRFDRDKLLLSLVGNDPTIFDVGANHGRSLSEFLELWPSGRMFCFEPQAECIESLSVIRDANPSREITIVEAAAGNQTADELTFYTHDIDAQLLGGLSGFHKMNLNSRDSLNLKEIAGNMDAETAYERLVNHERQVACVRLDEWMLSRGIERVDLLKMDTQGFEPQVLEGLGESLKNVSVVLTEIMFYDLYERSLSFYDIEQFLMPAGFELFDISHISKNPMNGRTDWVDVIYVNKKFRS